MDIRSELRNIAIIAHVDHGKTTLVDSMFKQSGIFRSNERVQERAMDSNDLERERGITILSKNTSVHYKDYIINIVDTPGHADFGGEVERVLGMVDGVLLLVDAFEGAMPQTKFVLKKALELNLQPIVVVNKIDRPFARPHEVVDEVLDLFIELEAEEHQLDFPVVYASSREGYAVLEVGDASEDLQHLFETIVQQVPPPSGEFDGPLQMLVTNIDMDEYVGRIAVGRIVNGRMEADQPVCICKKEGKTETGKINKLYKFEGLRRAEAQSAYMGDIVCLSGIANITIGETICNVDNPRPLPFADIDEPTISMTFCVNDSPFSGREGKFVTSRHLRDRLFKEIETNLSMRVEETDSADSFKVSGRGELHLSILIETMRRQGYEFQVSRPQVIFKKVDDVLCEPMEHLIIDVPEEYMGAIMEKLGTRKVEMVDMHNKSQGYTRVEFKIPSRGLIGYHSEFMSDTKGNGIMNHILLGYEPYKGEIPGRTRGSMVAWEDGDANAYGIFNAQDRGVLFIEPGLKIYQGMIVGMNSKEDDIVLNVCKKKQLTNTRASGSDESLRLITPIRMSLENCLEFIAEDELVEITPKSIRLRKKILHNEIRAKTKTKA